METTYEQRVDTFRSWPHSSPTASDMAAAGFAYAGPEDEAFCSYCKLKLIGWAKDDVPLEEHIRHSPDCPFILNQRNPTSNKGADVHLPQQTKGAMKHDRTSIKTSYDERLVTFGSWPHSHPPASSMAAGGFTHTGHGDNVVCSYCDVNLHNWVMDDVPLSEHARSNPDCPFVLQQQASSSAVPLLQTKTTDLLHLTPPTTGEAVRKSLTKTPTATSAASSTPRPATASKTAPATVPTMPRANSDRNTWIAKTITSLPSLIAAASLISPQSSTEIDYLDRWNKADRSLGDRHTIEFGKRKGLSSILTEIYSVHGALKFSVDHQNSYGNTFIACRDVTGTTKATIKIIGYQPRVKMPASTSITPSAVVTSVEGQEASDTQAEKPAIIDSITHEPLKTQKPRVHGENPASDPRTIRTAVAIGTQKDLDSQAEKQKPTKLRDGLVAQHESVQTPKIPDSQEGKLANPFTTALTGTKIVIGTQNFPVSQQKNPTPAFQTVDTAIAETIARPKAQGLRSGWEIGTDDGSWVEIDEGADEDEWICV